MYDGLCTKHDTKFTADLAILYFIHLLSLVLLKKQEDSTSWNAGFLIFLWIM